MASRSELQSHYASINDEALLEVYCVGPSGLTKDAWELVGEEVKARGLTVAAAEQVADLDPAHVLARDLRQDLRKPDGASRQIGEFLSRGGTQADALKAMSAAGFPSAEATGILQAVVERSRAAAVRSAECQLRRGAVWLAAGVGFTIWSWFTAGGRGGSFILYWGAILCGVVLIARARGRLEEAERE